MKKLVRNLLVILFMVGLLSLVVAPPALSQTGGPSQIIYPVAVPYQLGLAYTFTSSSVQTASFNTKGIGWYQMIWVPQGTVSGCTLTVDGLNAAGTAYTTGSLMTSQTCTSAGSNTIGSAVFATQGKITPTVTGSGSVTVFLFGFVNNPASAAAGAVTVSNFPSPQVVVLTVPTTIVSGQQAVTGTAAALASNLLAKGLCIEGLSTNTISVFVGPSGVTTSTGIEIPPGAGYCPAVSNSNAIFVVASTTGATVTWSGN
jgi:hypothetical protein